jgi:hypothetical protein
MFRVRGDALDDLGAETFKITVELMPEDIIAPTETVDLKPSSAHGQDAEYGRRWMCEEELVEVELLRLGFVFWWMVETDPLI